MEGGVYVNGVLFDKEGHLTEETLRALKFGNLKDEDLISILDHISDCQKCSGAFADSFKDDELADAPLGFQEKVQIKIQNKKQSTIGFSFYCAKVAIAASIALMMVFSNGLNFLASTKTNYVKPVDFSVLNSINTNLNSFSQKIIKLEVFNNDKEKK
ncbi:hypothetical protein [Clostridium saccharobutylicum]|uniref:hypothetical protein n=1 Tax=Clostridium saccharobutylicum TaxID=169679 RepID=UPI00098C1463